MSADQRKSRSPLRPQAYGWLAAAVIFAAALCFPLYAALSLGYSESKGPFKNSTQVIDLEPDGDLDVLVSHTRWEGVDLSWAGVGRWINQGRGRFELLPNDALEHFSGFAAGAGDVDQDGDPDIFVQEHRIRLLVNQGGQQGGVGAAFLASGGIAAPEIYSQGYHDLGGAITLGDLNGDGRLDAFIAGCCYGLEAVKRGNLDAYASSSSWVWINDGWQDGRLAGHILPLAGLDGLPVRQSALGDLDGDGDLDVLAAVSRPTLGQSAASGLMLLLNDGAGRLSLQPLAPDGFDATSAALGDMDGDGRLDILVGTDSGARLWLDQGAAGSGPRFTRSSQRFAARQSAWERLQSAFSSLAELFGLYLPYGSARAKAVFLDDLDADGDPDALIARTWWAEIWWNDGQATFTGPGLRFPYPEDSGLAVADFDRDGDLDLFSAGNNENLQLWWNDGRGSFTPSPAMKNR